jgi:hypothetical protein
LDPGFFFHIGGLFQSAVLGTSTKQIDLWSFDPCGEASDEILRFYLKENFASAEHNLGKLEVYLAVVLYVEDIVLQAETLVKTYNL